MQWLYLLSLLVGISGLAVLDRRYKLALWNKPRRTTAVIASAMGLFVIWDLLGVGLGIFYHGGSQYALPLRLLPEFPLEELVFLFLLTYISLLLYRGTQR